VLDEGIANSVGTILQGVVKNGTAQRAQIPNMVISGKTGTTENYGDAWFVGWTPEYTVAVWVGYPKKFQPMKTEFRGEPVAGGTYPAGIWKTFMESVLKIDPPPKPQGEDAEGVPGATPVPGTATTPAPAVPAPQETAPDTGGGQGDEAPAQREEPAPQEQEDIPPAEQPPTQPEGGTGETTPPSGGTAPPTDGTG
jgi:penicillin-binding protein 1A